MLSQKDACPATQAQGPDAGFPAPTYDEGVAVLACNPALEGAVLVGHWSVLASPSSMLTVLGSVRDPD